MILFIILGVVVFLTFGVLGVLFFMLNKEGNKKDKEKVVPVTDLEELKRELSNSKLFEQEDIKADSPSPEIIPVFTPTVTLPVQETQTLAEGQTYDKRSRELEDELLTISKKADSQSDEALKMVETLTKENEFLKSQEAYLHEAQQKLEKLQGEASGLKLDNAALQIQLESTNEKVHLLEEQMAAVKAQMGEEITRANALVTELKQEKETLLAAPKPEAELALAQELETLKFELRSE